MDNAWMRHGLLIVTALLLVVAARLLFSAPPAEIDGYGNCDVSILNAFMDRNSFDVSSGPLPPIMSSEACVDPARWRVAWACLLLLLAVGAWIARRRVLSSASPTASAA